MNLENAIKLIMDKLQSWMEDLVKMLPNLALAAIVLIIGVLIAKWISKLSKRMFVKFFPTNTLMGLAVNFIYILSIGIVLFIVLKILHLDGTITTMLASAGIIGLALAFAFQDIAANFISGIFISFRKPFDVGDTVKIKDYLGTVKEIRLRDTTLYTFEGHLVTIPNKEVFQNPIENFSQSGKRRVVISSGVSQGDDLNKAQQIAIHAILTIAGIEKEDVTFYYDGLGESTINFTVRVWVNMIKQPDFLKIQSEVVVKIKEAFEQNGISLPFPIRTLDFAMKGGKTLADMLNEADFSNEKAAR